MVLLLDDDFRLKPQNPGDTMVQGRRHEHRQPPFQTPLSGEKKISGENPATSSSLRISNSGIWPQKTAGLGISVAIWLQ